MNKKIVAIVVCTLLIATLSAVTAFGENSSPNDCGCGESKQIKLIKKLIVRQELDYGDAPEGDNAIAYPHLGITGSFPTCKSIGSWVAHNNFGGYFGPGVDFEPDGNAGTCPNCFPPYDQDECFQDGDAGLMFPEPFTINNSLYVVPCPNSAGTPLGTPGQTIVWGVDTDIDVTNFMPSQTPGYFNLIIDWNQNGKWGDTGEHAVPNFFPIPNGYSGPISALGPPNFVAGQNAGYVWARFTISEKNQFLETGMERKALKTVNQRIICF